MPKDGGWVDVLAAKSIFSLCKNGDRISPKKPEQIE
jgi:hypothetical protein